MKNGFFPLILILLFPWSSFGQGFADISPSAAPAPEVAPISFDQPAPVPVPASVAPATASSAVPPAKTTPKTTSLPAEPQSATLPNSRHSAYTPPSRESSVPDLKARPELLRSKVSEDHPFARFMKLPKYSQSLIKEGKPLTVAQLLYGTNSPVVRKQLLESYWELLGLLVEYNVRLESEQLAASSVRDAQQAQMIALFQNQRCGAEMKFIKKQWEFAELLRRSKGIFVTENTLPIPCDYPIYKQYETYADKIARSEQAKYLGHLLPVQQQLVDAKHRSCEAVFNLSSSMPSGSLQLIPVLNQRTEAFLALTQAVVEYNQMIAQYTAETVGPNISSYQLVGAVIELPKFEPQSPIRDNRRSGTAVSPSNPKLSSLPLPNRNEEFPADLPAETAATTFDKQELPKRTVAPPPAFPEAQLASPSEQIAADFSFPSKSAVKPEAQSPEMELFPELSSDPPLPTRKPRPIQQVSHAEE